MCICFTTDMVLLFQAVFQLYTKSLLHELEVGVHYTLQKCLLGRICIKITMTLKCLNSRYIIDQFEEILPSEFVLFL